MTSLLRVILQKLKWEENSDPDDMDDDDKAAFEDLRKVISSMHTVIRPLTEFAGPPYVYGFDPCDRAVAGHRRGADVGSQHLHGISQWQYRAVERR